MGQHWLKAATVLLHASAQTQANHSTARTPKQCLSIHVLTWAWHCAALCCAVLRHAALLWCAVGLT